jgi:cell division protein FtsB
MKKSEMAATIEALMKENQKLAADGISQAKEIERLNDMLSQRDTEISILKDRLVKYQRSEVVGDDR